MAQLCGLNRSPFPNACGPSINQRGQIGLPWKSSSFVPAYGDTHLSFWACSTRFFFCHYSWPLLAISFTESKREKAVIRWKVATGRGQHSWGAGQVRAVGDCCLFPHADHCFQCVSHRGKSELRRWARILLTYPRKTVVVVLHRVLTSSECMWVVCSSEDVCGYSCLTQVPAWFIVCASPSMRVQTEVKINYIFASHFSKDFAQRSK